MSVAIPRGSPVAPVLRVQKRERAWIALHIQGQGAHLGWASLTHPSRRSLPGRWFPTGSLSPDCTALQDLVVGNTANQQQSIIILTAIYAVLTVCQHLTSFKFCGGRIFYSHLTDGGECSQDACEWLSGSLNPDLPVFKPVPSITPKHYPFAFSPQTWLVTFQIKTGHMDDRWALSLPLVPMWCGGSLENWPFSSPAKRNRRLCINLQTSFKKKKKERKHQIVGYGQKNKIQFN